MKNSTGTANSNLKATRVNPYEVSESQQGWRGLGLPGNHKRKWYTVLHNETVLVTALITLPGETSVRHAHESGELSMNFKDRMNPSVTWHPPFEFHGGGGGVAVSGVLEEQAIYGEQERDAVLEKSASGRVPELEFLMGRIDHLESQVNRLLKMIEQQSKAEVAPRLLIDIIFPPFRTIIDDPRFPPKRVITGQWFD